MRSQNTAPSLRKHCSPLFQQHTEDFVRLRRKELLLSHSPVSEGCADVPQRALARGLLRFLLIGCLSSNTYKLAFAGQRGREGLESDNMLTCSGWKASNRHGRGLLFRYGALNHHVFQRHKGWRWVAEEMVCNCLKKRKHLNNLMKVNGKLLKKFCYTLFLKAGMQKDFNC